MKNSSIGSIVLASLLFSGTAFCNDVKFSEKYSLTEKEASKVISRLQKEMLKDKDAYYVVDIFISDQVPTMDINSIGNHVHATAEMVYDVETMSIDRVSLNGELSDLETINNQIDTDNEVLNTRNEYRKWARSQNLDTLAKAIKDEVDPNILSKAIDNGVPYVTLKLKGKTVKKLLKKAEKSLYAIDLHVPFQISADNLLPDADDNDVLKTWKPTFGGYLRGTSVLQVQEQWTDLQNTKGQDVDIYYSDAECPAAGDTVFDGYLAPKADHYTISYTDGNMIEAIKNEYDYNHPLRDQKVSQSKAHTKIVTGILSTVASEADLFCKSAQLSNWDATGSDFYNTDVSVYDDVLPTSTEVTGIDIESYSLNKESSIAYNHYFPMDKVFDDHTFQYRKVPVFISAGNATNVVSPAKAFNVITVGNYQRNIRINDDDSITFLSHSIHSSSSYSDPQVGTNSYQKPEISGPGAEYYQNYTNQVGTITHDTIPGTSFSTPFAAAIAADLMSHNTFYKNSSAAVVKAAMIAGATDFVFGGQDRVGEGGIDLLTSTWALTNAAWMYDYTPTRPFIDTVTDAHGTRDCFTNWQTYLYNDREARIVISWLNKVDNTSLTRIPNSYTLEVLDPYTNLPVNFTNAQNLITNIANEPDQGYQVINLPSATGVHKIRVCKTNNNDNNRFDIGLAVSQRPNADVTWWHH